MSIDNLHGVCLLDLSNHLVAEHQNFEEILLSALKHSRSAVDGLLVQDDVVEPLQFIFLFANHLVFLVGEFAL